MAHRRQQQRRKKQGRKNVTEAQQKKLRELEHRVAALQKRHHEREQRNGVQGTIPKTLLLCFPLIMILLIGVLTNALKLYFVEIVALLLLYFLVLVLYFYKKRY